MKQLVAAVAVLVALVFLSGPVDAQEYLCVPDLATGFTFRDNAWTSAKFKVEGQYLIAPSSRPDRAFGVTKIGEGSEFARCELDFNEPGFLFCEGLGVELKFNRANGRFLRVDNIGYLNVLPEVNDITDQTSDTPVIEIGKCSPLPPRGR